MANTPKKDYYEILGAKMWAMAVVGLIVSTALAAQDSSITGRVTDSHAQPIADVMVAGTQELAAGGPREFKVRTDADGNYSLASVGQIIFFRKNGYRPFTYKRTATETTLNITLPLEDSGWKVPRCTEEQQRQRRYGDRLRFQAPRSAKAKKGEPDADNWRVFLSFPGNRKEGLIIWSGPLLGGGFGYIAPEQWYKEASTVLERSDREFGIIDVRGTTPGGRHWRSISWMTDIVWYHDASAEAAQFFDRIIDSGCLSIP
ncbi:MAG: carboxypeptidase-like regulatory domain-containing protein [Candidatus Sulfotelmatobacter sp.]